MRKCRVALLFLLSLVAVVAIAVLPAKTYGALIFLEGEHTAVFHFPNFADADLPEFIPYENYGFSQKLEKDDLWQTLTIKSWLQPITTASPWPIDTNDLPDAVRIFLQPSPIIQSDDPAIQRTGRELIEKYKPKTVEELTRIIISFAKEQVTYDLTVTQDSLTALNSGRGSCVGISCLVIALLRQAGVPARAALGYNPPGYNWGQKEDIFGVLQTGGGFHMWLEVYYPRTGWIFSDPANSIDHIDVYHWVTEVARDENVNPRFLKRIGDAMQAARMSIDHDQDRNTINVVGVREDLATKANLFSRRSPTDAIQFVGTARIAVVSAKNGKPLPTARVHRFQRNKVSYFIHDADKNGVVELPPLEAGTYTVRATAQGHAESPQQHITIEKGKATTLTISLAEGGEVLCLVTDDRGKPLTTGKIVFWSKRFATAYPLLKNGTFLFEGLTPGDYQFSIEHPEYKDTKHTVTVKPGQRAELKITGEKK